VDLLLRDVHAYLASLPISARPPTLRYRAGKFVRRHRAPVIAAAVATVAVLGGGVAAGVGMIRAQAAEEAALEEARVAEEISEFLVQLFAQPDPDNALGEEMTARELLQTGVERIDADLVAQPTLQARLKNTMARSFGGLGDFAEAESLLLGALDQVPSDEISLRADLLMSLGGLRRIRGDREGSLDVLVQAIEITRPRVDTTDMASMERTPQLSDALIGALQEVGVVLAESGGYGPAIDTLEHAYRLRERRSGSGTEATATSAAALASGYGMSGDTERARELYRSAIDVYSEVHDERHPSMLIALDGLATAYAQDGQFDSALVIYERLRPLQRDVWGDAHPRTAQSLLNLGALNSQLGRYEEARTYLRESLEIETARFGPENLQVTSSLINLAIVNSNLGELEEAEALFSRAAGIRRATIGADNPRFASALLGVANMRRQLGRWQGSADAYAEALDVLRSSGDVPPPVLKDYAEVLRQLGRDAEAAVVDEELAALTADGSGEVGSA
jgi:tetratricopeptide (TPR) repeat protein